MKRLYLSLGIRDLNYIFIFFLPLIVNNYHCDIPILD